MHIDNYLVLEQVFSKPSDTQMWHFKGLLLSSTQLVTKL